MRIISGSLTLDATDKDILTVPKPFTGKLVRIGAKNPTTSDIDITIKDKFTPDPSSKVPKPTEVIKDRYSFKVVAGDDIDLDGRVFAKILGTFRVTSSATGVIFSYILELE